MKTYVSLWSANLLDVGADIDRVNDHCDGFHIDITDGHLTPQLLFGPDFVRAVRGRTRKTIDVHLMVTHSDRWIGPFLEAGADMVTVHRRGCADVSRTLAAIEEGGGSPSLAIETDEPVTSAVPHLDAIDRILLMGTAIGIKGVEPDPAVFDRIREAIGLGEKAGAGRPEVFVDGGIREHTVASMAAAGCEGVIPGSLAFGAPDPVASLAWIRGLRDLGTVPNAGAR